MLEGDALKEATRQLADEIRTKVAHAQGGVGTFADHALLGFIGQLDQLETAQPWERSLADLSSSIDTLRQAVHWLRQSLARRSHGRFVSYEERTAAPSGVHGMSDLGYFEMVLSQGAHDCMHWKGLPLFKTAYDLAIYQMLLWALQPRTIIELGSGSGASAVWLTDLMATFGLDTRVHSVDTLVPGCRDSRIHFVQGDCATPEAMIDAATLATAPHPWLLIEDAHVNTYGVLRFFDAHLAEGDYVIVEDSAGKQDEIRRFLQEAPGTYKVDTYYTDFFGRNVTCAPDSILVRTSARD